MRRGSLRGVWWERWGERCCWFRRGGDPEALRRIVWTLGPGHGARTLGVMLGAALTACVLGVPAAWVLATMEFRGRRVGSWLALAPLAAPPYVAALSWSELLGQLGGAWGAAFVLGASLSPYVTLASWASFGAQGRRAAEAARSSGAGSVGAFFRAALPSAVAGDCGGGVVGGVGGGERHRGGGADGGADFVVGGVGGVAGEA